MSDRDPLIESQRLCESVGSADLQIMFASVYTELKRVAHRQLVSNSNSTLHTTDLVHETYLKLIKPDAVDLSDRLHFFRLAARAMRQILIDHARARQATKRGGALLRDATVDDSMASDGINPEDLIHLDHALNQLQKTEPKLSELVELRYFAGLSVEQVAELNRVTPRTVIRDWRRARIFLFDLVQADSSH
jgi:RNA polymerase sigma factor (TIGR02999 family)